MTTKSLLSSTRSRFAVWTVFAYVVFAFACEGSRNVEQEFDYSVSQQQNAVASVTGIWENSDASMRVTICESDGDAPGPRETAISGRATAPLHVQVLECCQGYGDACNVAHACRCAPHSVFVSIEMQIMGGGLDGSLRGTARFTSGGPTAINEPTRRTRTFEVADDSRAMFGTFQADTSALTFGGDVGADDAGTSLESLSRVGDASCP